MINILPEEKKKEIRITYYMRLGIVAGWACSLLILASMVLLAPSYMISVSKYKNAEDDLTALQSGKKKGEREQEINTEILAVNKKVAVLSQRSNTSSLSFEEMVAIVLQSKKETVRLQSFTYSKGIKGMQVVITGTASNRDSLADFVDLLKKDARFSRVELPISSYVKSTDISFSLIVENTL